MPQQRHNSTYFRRIKKVSSLFFATRILSHPSAAASTYFCEADRENCPVSQIYESHLYAVLVSQSEEGDDSTVSPVTLLEPHPLLDRDGRHTILHTLAPSLSIIPEHDLEQNINARHQSKRAIMPIAGSSASQIKATRGRAN